MSSPLITPIQSNNNNSEVPPSSSSPRLQPSAPPASSSSTRPLKTLRKTALHLFLKKAEELSTEESFQGPAPAYKGLHAPRAPLDHVIPPFKSPVKPSYKKASRKKPSIFTKLIKREDDQQTPSVVTPPSPPDEKARQNSSLLVASSRSHARKGIFGLYPALRLKLVSLDRLSGLASSAQESPRKPTLFFDIDRALDNMDMAGVVQTNAVKSAPRAPETPERGAWAPPDSWAVKKDVERARRAPALDPPFILSSHDAEEDPLSEVRAAPAAPATLVRRPQKALEEYVIQPKGAEPELPALLSPLKELKGNFMMRVWKSAGEFKTFSPGIDDTAADILKLCKKKFFLDSVANYQLVFRLGPLSKALEPEVRPLRMMCSALLLAGYDAKRDNFRILGSKDSISYLCRFSLEDTDFVPEDPEKPRNYISVDLVDRKLCAIPLVYYLHIFKIESLDVSKNPLLLLAADFIAGCSKLRRVAFDESRLTGFPQALLEARELTRLSVSRNEIRHLPERIGSLVYLTKLYLSCNRLSMLPSLFSRLRNLKVLDLLSNAFAVFPQPLTDLTTLAVLDLSYNQISALPEYVGRMANLEELLLAHNRLSGALPQHIAQLSKLRVLDVQRNILANVDAAGRMPSLETVLIGRNRVSRATLGTGLRTLELDHNPVIEVPQSSLPLDALTTLDLRHAKLTLFSSSDLARVPNVETLLLDCNALSFLPDNIGLLKRLVFLSVHLNRLQVLPDALGDLHSLRYLDVHSNNIKKLPTSIWYCLLVRLNAASNLLQGFPVSEEEIHMRDHRSASEAAVLRTNALTRMLSARAASDPTEKGGAVENGRTPAAPALALTLQHLVLLDNSLLEDCFELLAPLSALQTLNLAYTELVEIPGAALRHFPELTHLYLSGNSLNALPGEDLATLAHLRALYVNGNQLRLLPHDLSKMRSLRALDAGLNALRYNTLNYQYDWNWQWNMALRYLNLLGNKRLEISRAHADSVRLDSFTGLPNLRVLGLMDVTLKSLDLALPDELAHVRVRTTPSQAYSITYGLADAIGEGLTREGLYTGFRGRENELLMCLFDGLGESEEVPHILAEHFREIFSAHLEEAERDSDHLSDDSILDAFRRTFLALNSLLLSECPDADTSGCSVTALYLKGSKLYSANVGDSIAVLSRASGEHDVLSSKHDPREPSELERIRLCGGAVSRDMLDGASRVSRAAGLLGLLPHLSACPSMRTVLVGPNEMVVMGTQLLWEHVLYETAVDVVRQHKNDPMKAAAKLRDFAVAYGARGRVTVMVLAQGSTKNEGNGIAPKKRSRPHDSALGRLDEIPPPSGMLAMVFTDIKSLTLLWEGYPSAMRSAIQTHNSIMRRQLRLAGGYEVKTEGDAFMVSFPSAVSALIWCLNVQIQLLAGDWPAEILESSQCCEIRKREVIYRGLLVRMGVHWGEPVCEPDAVTGRMDYFGPMVNRALRVSSVADGGEICMSSDFMRELERCMELHNRVKAGESVESVYGDGGALEREITQLESVGYVTKELGEKKLKGLESPEFILVAYPKKLEERMDFEQENGRASSGVLGLVSPQSLAEMEACAVKLEHLCSVAKGTPLNRELLEMSTKEWAERWGRAVRTESDCLIVMENVITRVENAGVVLDLQTRSLDIQ